MLSVWTLGGRYSHTSQFDNVRFLAFQVMASLDAVVSANPVSVIAFDSVESQVRFNGCCCGSIRSNPSPIPPHPFPRKRTHARKRTQCRTFSSMAGATHRWRCCRSAMASWWRPHRAAAVWRSLSTTPPTMRRRRSFPILRCAAYPFECLLASVSHASLFYFCFQPSHPPPL